MYLLYKPYISEKVTSEDIKRILANQTIIDQAVLHAYTMNFGNNGSDNLTRIEGQNVIINEIIKQYVNRLLEIDTHFTPFQIIDLENTYKINLSVQTVHGMRYINLGGKIDRIDKVREGIRIIDYKTGKASRSFSDISSLTDRENKNRNKEAFQTLLYAKIYSSSEIASNPQKVIPGLYILRQLYDEFLDYRLEIGTGRNRRILSDLSEIDKPFLQAVTLLLEELFNPEVSFRQTDNIEICRTCPYRGICHRESDI